MICITLVPCRLEVEWAHKSCKKFFYVNIIIPWTHEGVFSHNYNLHSLNICIPRVSWTFSKVLILLQTCMTIYLKQSTHHVCFSTQCVKKRGFSCSRRPHDSRYFTGTYMSCYSLQYVNLSFSFSLEEWSTFFNECNYLIPKACRERICVKS